MVDKHNDAMLGSLCGLYGFGLHKLCTHAIIVGISSIF